jgi:hypothetical protein
LSNGDKLSDEDKILWDLMLQQDKTILQHFGTTVVGIGALFFAYGEIVPLHLRFLTVIIALIGLAASLIVWMNVFGSIQQGQAIRDDLKASKSATVLMERHEKIMGTWRDKKSNHWLYYPVKKLEMYFSALVSLAWLTILLTAGGIPFVLIFAFDLIVFGVIAGHAFTNWHRHD